MSIKGTLLRVKFFDNQEEKPFRGSKTFETSLKNFKVFLSKCQGKWEYATIYKDGSLYCYFHKNKGLAELDKQQYVNELKCININLYIVYTLDHKLKTGDHSAKAVWDASLEDVSRLYDNTVQKIIAYQDNKIIATYEHGRFI